MDPRTAADAAPPPRTKRDVIAAMLAELDHGDGAYDLADELIGRLDRHRKVVMELTVRGEITSFVGGSDVDQLRAIADWIEADPDRAFIGAWSTGYSGPLSTEIQVVTDPPTKPRPVTP